MHSLADAVNDNVDYGAPAELFPAAMGKKSAVTYRRFDTLGEAIRFAMEEMPPTQFPGAVIEADEVRYGPAEIRGLYAAAGYPLPRKGGTAV